MVLSNTEGNVPHQNLLERSARRLVGGLNPQPIDSEFLAEDN